MVKVFNNKGTFEAFYAAENYAREQGYSVGSMCRSMPIALKKGDYHIAKWRNLSKLERLDIDGHITSKDFREGIVTVDIFNNEE